MTELWTGTGATALALVLLFGAALGLVFFGGLWWTALRMARPGHSALLPLASYLVRMAVFVGGFLFALQGAWERALACLAGFLAARALVRRRVARAASAETRDAAHS